MCGDKILPRSCLASLGSRRNAVAAQNVSHRLIGQAVTQIGQSSDDAVISPAGVLSRHSHYQGFHFRWNRRAAWILPVFGAVELIGDELPIPSEDGIGLGDTGDLLKSRSAESLTDLSEGGALGIREAHTGRKVSSQDAILGRQIFVSGAAVSD